MNIIQMIKTKSLNHHLKTLQKKQLDQCIDTQAHFEPTTVTTEHQSNPQKIKTSDFKINLPQPVDKNRLVFSKMNRSHLGERLRILLDLD